MIPERTFKSEDDLRAHYRAVQVRLGLSPAAPKPRPAPPEPPEREPVPVPVPEPDPAPADSSPPTVKAIIAQVAAEHRMTSEDILGPSRRAKAIAARHAAMAAAYRARPEMSLEWHGLQFKRDHTTVHNALQKLGLKPPRVRLADRPGVRRHYKSKLSDEQRRLACDLYRQGLTCREIENLHFQHVSHYCIYRALVRHGVPRRAAKVRPSAGLLDAGQVSLTPSGASFVSRVISRLQAFGALVRRSVASVLHVRASLGSTASNHEELRQCGQTLPKLPGNGQ